MSVGSRDGRMNLPVGGMCEGGGVGGSRPCGNCVHREEILALFREGGCEVGSKVWEG